MMFEFVHRMLRNLSDSADFRGCTRRRMKAIIDSFQFPGAFSDTCKFAEITWDKIMHRLQYFPPEDMRAWLKSTSEYGFSLVQNKNNANIQRVSVMLLAIYRFYYNDITPLNDFFVFIMKAEERETAQLAAYCIAKITLSGSPTNEKYALMYLTQASKMISNKGNKKANIMGLNLAKAFAEHGHNFFILNCEHSLAGIWGLLFSTNEEVQMLAVETFTKYLVALIKTKAYRLSGRFNECMTKCMNCLLENDYSVPLGVVSIITKLLELKPEFFVNSTMEIYQNITAAFNSAKMPLKKQYLLIYAHLSVVDTLTFHLNLFKNVFECFIESMRYPELVKTATIAFSILCDNIPEPIFEKSSIILSACVSVIQSKDIENIKAVLNLLKKMLIMNPLINITQSQSVWKIVSSLLFTPNFHDLFPYLDSEGSPFWKEHALIICTKVLNALDTISDYLLHALKLIPLLPSIPNGLADIMIPKVKKYLFARNDDLRSEAPKALLHIMSYNEDPVEFSRTLKELIAIAASDISLRVRISIISSFGPAHYPFLAHDPFLKFLKNLANDNSSEVRCYCFNVLKNTRKYSPIGSDAILRNALINALYALQCSPSSFERANATESLPSLIEASAVLFPVYATTMIPIIIKQLRDRGTNNTVIGYEADTQLTINLIKTLHEILRVNYQTISPYLTQILPIFTTILKAYSNKKIKKLIIEALSLFVKKTEKTANIYVIAPQLLDALLSIVSQSESKSLKVKALQLLGQAGAVNPQRIPSEKTDYSRSDNKIQLKNGVPQNEYFGSLVFPKLMEMVNDKYQTVVRTMSLSTAITTLSLMPTQSSEHLSLIIPILLNHIQSSTDVMRVESIKQLKSLTIVAKQQMYPHVENILNCIYTQWEATDLCYFIDVISSIVNGLGTDFLPFLYPLVSRVRRTISSSVVTNPSLAKSCLELSATLTSIFPNLTHLFIPQLCKILSSVFVTKNIKVTALKTLKCHLMMLNPQTYAGSIFSVVNNLCIDSDPTLADNALKVLSTLVLLIGKNVTYYAHRIIDVLNNDARAAYEFEKIMNKMKDNQKPQLSSLKQRKTENVRQDVSVKTQQFDAKIFIRCFNDDKMYTPKHWENWYSNLVNTSISTSPCATINCCYQLALINREFANYIFPAAFSSCWNELSELEQIALSRKLSKSLQNPRIPQNLLHSMISLIEQMEHVSENLQFPTDDIIKVCIRSHSLTLAMHYAQDNYLKTKEESMLRKYAILLAEISKSSDNSPLLNIMKKPISKELLLRMKQWEKAYPYYEEKMEDGTASQEDFIGYIYCAKNLFKYKEIIDHTGDVLSSYKVTISNVAQIFSEAAFFTDINMMPFFSSFDCESSLENLSMKALSLVVSKKYNDANKVVDKMFEIIATRYLYEFRAPYQMVYPFIVWCQFLYELKEAIETKGNIPGNIWKQRLADSEANADVWFTLLLPRIAVTPNDKSYINMFLEISRQEGKYTMFNAFFKHFYPDFNPDDPMADHVPSNIYLRYLNATEGKDVVIDKLTTIINNREVKPLHFTQVLMYFDISINDALYDEELLGDIYYIFEELGSNKNAPLLEKWAFTNYYIYRLDRTQIEYAIEAMKCFHRSISQQLIVNYSDMCALFSLFFETVADPRVSQISLPLFDELSDQKVGEMIPQLFSFAFSTNHLAKEAAMRKLVQIIKSSPHMLLFYVLSFDENQAPQVCIKNLIGILANEKPTLYNETMIFRKLITEGSQTIFEKWLSPSRDLISSLVNENRTNKTVLENIFFKLNEGYIRDLNTYMSTGKLQLVNRTVQQIVINCQGFVKKLETIHLNDIFENVPTFENSEIIIPGATSMSHIQSLSNELTVMPVRTRPRRITITGRDGNQYNFLIKIQKNTAFNIRMTQFATLIKMLLKRNLNNSSSIPFSFYNVCPITCNLCLIQCTKDLVFYELLVSKFRSRNGIEPLAENNDISNLTISKIDCLMPLQRLEALGRIEVHHDDLKNAIWQLSSTSDEWYEKFVGFSSSFSLTSCLIGLGWIAGRNPSNILIDTKTCEVYHIDFSLVFGDGEKLNQFQDCVPFRLTPMLVSALGVDGLNMRFIPLFRSIHSIMKDYAYQILPVVSIYAEEPVKPFPQQKTKAEKEMIFNRMNYILLDNEETIDEYIEHLIVAAKDKYSISKEHSTWRPLW